MTSDIEPDLTIFFYKDILTKHILSENGIIRNQVIIRPLFKDETNPIEIGYYQWNQILHKSNGIYSGLVDFYLPEGTITVNVIFKRTDGPCTVTSEILCGTEKFLNVKGNMSVVIGSACTNLEDPIDRVYSYFKK
jgi:hypothetical protein